MYLEQIFRSSSFVFIFKSLHKIYASIKSLAGSDLAAKTFIANNCSGIGLRIFKLEYTLKVSLSSFNTDFKGSFISSFIHLSGRLKVNFVSFRMLFRILSFVLLKTQSISLTIHPYPLIYPLAL